MTTPKKRRQKAVDNCNMQDKFFNWMGAGLFLLLIWAVLNGDWIWAAIMMVGTASCLATSAILQALSVHLENLSGPDL